MAKAGLNDGQRLMPSTTCSSGRMHVSARYVISMVESGTAFIQRNHSVKPGWDGRMASRDISAGGIGRANNLSGTQLATASECKLHLGCGFLFFYGGGSVPEKTSAATLVCGQVTPGQPLRLLSQMPEYGVISATVLKAISRIQLRFASRHFRCEKKGHLVV